MHFEKRLVYPFLNETKKRKSLFFFKILFVIFTLNLSSLYAAENAITDIEQTFIDSPKFLVSIRSHIPDDSVITPSEWDPLTYWTLNTAFPKVSQMPGLDTCPYAVILPLTEEIASKIVAFHPTETELIGNIHITEHQGIVIAPHDSVLPQWVNLENGLQAYEGQSFENRNNAVRNYIQSKGAYPITLITDSVHGWYNGTPAHVTINNQRINVNQETLYPLPQNVPYSCPSSCYKWDETANMVQPYAVGWLPELKNIVYDQTNAYKDNDAINAKNNLIRWIQSLHHIQDSDKMDFETRVNTAVDYYFANKQAIKEGQY